MIVPIFSAETAENLRKELHSAGRWGQAYEAQRKASRSAGDKRAALAAIRAINNALCNVRVALDQTVRLLGGTYQRRPDWLGLVDLGAAREQLALAGEPWPQDLSALGIAVIDEVLAREDEVRARWAAIDAEARA